MKRLTATDAFDLSISERIQLVEDVWDTIAIKADVVELTEEEKKVIDERLKTYHQSSNLASPWQDIFKRIVSKK